MTEPRPPHRADDRRPRTIVTTDPELDDLNSMLRMLLYANEIDLVGLVYSSSQFHFAGDPERGVAPHRWPHPGSVFHIDQAVDAYEQAYPNLRVHDPRYPSPDHLRSLIAWGNVDDVGDMSQPTPGSDLIRDVLLDDNPGQVFLQTWGGHNTIARALRSIQDQYEGTADWGGIRAAVTRKAVITSFGQQDATFAHYIRPNWPDLESREVATTVWGYFARSVVAERDQHLLTPDWMRRNVSTVGPMGAQYRVWGDGRQMAAGFDDEDYFGLAGRTAEDLVADGYRVWMPPQQAGGWISEGDSSNFALLVDNGLRSWEHPAWGGWGGRQARVDGHPASWSNHGVRDLDEHGASREDWSAARWFAEIQHDLAARLQWTVQDQYGRANHHPVVSIAEGVDLVRRCGAAVQLTADAVDPDGDELSFRWWQYREAGTCGSELELRPIENQVEFTIPDDAVEGETLHIVLEVTDSGTPALTAYQRVVIEIAGS